MVPFAVFSQSSRMRSATRGFGRRTLEVTFIFVFVVAAGSLSLEAIAATNRVSLASGARAAFPPLGHSDCLADFATVSRWLLYALRSSVTSIIPPQGIGRRSSHDGRVWRWI